MLLLVFPLLWPQPFPAIYDHGECVPTSYSFGVPLAKVGVTCGHREPTIYAQRLVYYRQFSFERKCICCSSAIHQLLYRISPLVNHARLCKSHHSIQNAVISFQLSLNYMRSHLTTSFAYKYCVKNRMHYTQFYKLSKGSRSPVFICDVSCNKL